MRVWGDKVGSDPARPSLPNGHPPCQSAPLGLKMWACCLCLSVPVCACASVSVSVSVSVQVWPPPPLPGGQPFGNCLSPDKVEDEFLMADDVGLTYSYDTPKVRPALSFYVPAALPG
eukprot:3491907-Rhodomonas_salina.2